MPIPESYILLENSDNILLEDGSSFLLQEFGNVFSNISQPLFNQSSVLTNLSPNTTYQVVTASVGNYYIIQNTGTSTVYVGASNVSITLGIAIAPGGFFPDNKISSDISRTPVSWWVMSPSSGQVIVTTFSQTRYQQFYSGAGNS